jgi:hypothetical protein
MTQVYRRRETAEETLNDSKNFSDEFIDADSHLENEIGDAGSAALSRTKRHNSALRRRAQIKQPFA